MYECSDPPNAGDDCPETKSTWVRSDLVLCKSKSVAMELDGSGLNDGELGKVSTAATVKAFPTPLVAGSERGAGTSEGRGEIARGIEMCSPGSTLS